MYTCICCTAIHAEAICSVYLMVCCICIRMHDCHAVCSICACMLIVAEGEPLAYSCICSAEARMHRIGPRYTCHWCTVVRTGDAAIPRACSLYGIRYAGLRNRLCTASAVVLSRYVLCANGRWYVSMISWRRTIGISRCSVKAVFLVD